MCDLATFRAFVLAARAKGAIPAIASYGRRDVIDAYLERIFSGAAEPPFAAAMIVTPSDFGQADGTPLAAPGKPKMLSLLCKRAVPPVDDPAAVLFFDDDEVNVDDAHDAGYELSVHLPTGFSAASLRALEDGDFAMDYDQAGDAFAQAWGHDENDPYLVKPPS